MLGPIRLSSTTAVQAASHRACPCRVVCLEISARRARRRWPMAAAMGWRGRSRSAVPLCRSARLVPWRALRQLRGGRVGLVWIRQSGPPVAERHPESRAAVGARSSRGRTASGCSRRSATGPYRHDGTIVPTYPAGLPMLMAAVPRRVRRQRTVLRRAGAGALLLWLTYVLGKEATGSQDSGRPCRAAAAGVAGVSHASAGSDVRYSGGRGLDAGGCAGAEAARRWPAGHCLRR